MSPFQKELEQLINKHSMENGSNTPDFILASYLYDCLKTFNMMIWARERYYGRPSVPTNKEIASQEDRP